MLERNGVPFCQIFGALQPTGRSPSFAGLLRTFYHDSGRQFLLSLTWGGYKSRDVAICTELA
jgi:hypothetical protein